MRQYRPCHSQPPLWSAAARRGTASKHYRHEVNHRLGSQKHASHCAWADHGHVRASQPRQEQNTRHGAGGSTLHKPTSAELPARHCVLCQAVESSVGTRFHSPDMAQTADMVLPVLGPQHKTSVLAASAQVDNICQPQSSSSCSRAYQALQGHVAKGSAIEGSQTANPVTPRGCSWAQTCRDTQHQATAIGCSGHSSSHNAPHKQKHVLVCSLACGNQATGRNTVDAITLARRTKHTCVRRAACSGPVGPHASTPTARAEIGMARYDTVRLCDHTARLRD